MSEVSQLCEMNAELSASKESNDRRRQEAVETSIKIGDLEKRLEEQVSITDRHRDKKATATAVLEKRVQEVGPAAEQGGRIQHHHLRKQRLNSLSGDRDHATPCASCCSSFRFP